jgi:arginase
MKYLFIIVPFHVGIHRHRVGKGPERIFEQLEPLLNGQNITYRTVSISTVDSFEGEIGKSFELLRRIASVTQEGCQNHEFPIVLAGNCNSSVGVAAGLASTGMNLDDLRVYWIDAHPDVQTPDDNESGYFDSMGTSMLAGMSWRYHMSTLEKRNNPVRIPLSNFTFIATRDMKPSEQQRIIDNGAYCIQGGQKDIPYPGLLAKRLQQQASDHRSLIHVDLDSLDTTIGRANDYAVPDGLFKQDLIEIIRLLAVRHATSITFASLDPDLENGSAIVDIAVEAILELISILG